MLGIVMDATLVYRTESTAAGWISRAAKVAASVLGGRVKGTPARPLPRLDAVYPGARLGARRSRGLAAVSVADIVGTASYAPETRQWDFLPTPGHEPADWQTRWQRLEAASRSLTTLPPIEVLKAGRGYWVVDGHNRVALARATGQAWIDADVTELLPSPHQVMAPAPRTTPGHGGID